MMLPDAQMVSTLCRWEAVESVSSLLQHLPGDVVTRIVEFFHIYDVLNAPLFLLRARLRLHCEQSSNLDLSCENIGTHHAWVTCMQRLLSEAASFEFHSLRMPAIASATCEGFEGLLGTLRAGIWPSLTALDLQECEVNYDHARGLADAVKSFPGLAAITLPELKDGSTQWPGQATFTVAGALCSLSALYSVVIPVSKCTSGVATLCQELGSGCNRLTRLEFDPLVCGIGEPLDAYRLSTVTANLLMQGVVAFSASLRVLKLPLSASKKGPHFPSGMHSDVHVLCNHVSNLTALTYLDVVYDAYEWRNSCPTFGNRLLCMLSTLVDQLRSLRVLRFVCQNIQFCPSDTSVDDHMPLVRESFERLEEVDIRGEDGDLLFPLSRLLQGVEAIKSVHVIDQENAETLGGVIRDSNSHCVENLHLLSSLKELNLEMSSDFPVSCRNSLAESVGKLSHLRKLCIRQRCFWPNASESLLAKVASMSELQQLQYSCYGGNGDTECKSLADEVEYLQNTVAASLTSLDVRRVDRVGFHHIMVVCRHLSMLRSLKLESFPNELPHACRVALLLRDVPLLNCVDLCVSVACEDVPVEVGREVHQSSEVEKKGVEQRAGSLQAADVLGRALGRLTELTRLSLKLDLGRDQALTPVGEMGSHLTSLCKLRTISMRVSTRSCLGVAYDVRNAGQLLRPHVAGLCVPVHEL